MIRPLAVLAGGRIRWFSTALSRLAMMVRYADAHPRARAQKLRTWQGQESAPGDVRRISQTGRYTLCSGCLVYRKRNTRGYVGLDWQRMA